MNRCFIFSKTIANHVYLRHKRTYVPVKGSEFDAPWEACCFFCIKKSIDRLFSCNRLSADVWNRCLEVAKNHHQKTGKWINRTNLQKAIKRIVPLHSQSIQAVAHKYLYARDSTKNAKARGVTNARYPYRKKRYFNTKWVDQAFKLEGNKIILSIGARQEPIVVFTSNLPKGDIKEIELCYDNGLFLSVSYNDG